MNRFIALFLAFVFAIPAQAYVIKESKQDEDIVFYVNDGGTVTEVLNIDGATGNFDFKDGAITISGDTTVNANIYGNISSGDAGADDYAFKTLSEASNARHIISAWNADDKRIFNVTQTATNAGQVAIRDSSGAETVILRASGDSVFNGGNITTTGNVTAKSLQADQAGSAALYLYKSGTLNWQIYNDATDSDKLKIGIGAGGTTALSISNTGSIQAPATIYAGNGDHTTTGIFTSSRTDNGYFYAVNRDSGTRGGIYGDTSFLWFGTATGGGGIKLFTETEERLVIDGTSGDVSVPGELIPDILTIAKTTTTLTIASGGITPTKSFHFVETEGGAASDDLADIDSSNFSVGSILVLTAIDSSKTVVIKDGVGNIQASGDFSMDHSRDTIVLIFTGTNWLELSRSDNES